jgi:hypothetical protein
VYSWIHKCSAGHLVAAYQNNAVHLRHGSSGRVGKGGLSADQMQASSFGVMSAMVNCCMVFAACCGSGASFSVCATCAQQPLKAAICRLVIVHKLLNLGFVHAAPLMVPNCASGGYSVQDMCCLSYV